MLIPRVTDMDNKTLGVLLPWQGMYIHSEMLQGVRSLAIPMGYRTLAFYGDMNGLHQHIDTSHIVGWIIANSSFHNEWLNTLDRRIPQIIISPDEFQATRTIVCPDNQHGARIAVEHLISHGHRRIVFIGGLRHADIAGRYQGYQQALHAAGIALDPALIVNITWEEFWRRDAADEAITDMLMRDISFTAVFAASDELALGVILALQRLNIHVPRSVAVIGFDDSPAAVTARPPLTTVRQSFFALGETAARCLIEMIAAETTEVTTRQVAGEMVVRESCGCAPQYIRDSILTMIESQSHDEKIQIMAIVHSLVSSIHKPNAEVYASISHLYKGFRGALFANDLSAWSSALEQNLPMLLQHAEMISNIPFALQMLSHSVIFPETGIKPAPETIERAKQFVHIAEQAAMFFSRLGAQTQQNDWFEIANSIRTVSTTLVHLDYDNIISLKWLYSCDIHHEALYLVDPESGHLFLRGLFHESRSMVQTLLNTPIDTLPIPEGLPREIETPCMLHALSFNRRPYGWLYIVPKAQSTLISQTYYGIWVEQLAGLLDRLFLEKMLQRSV